MIITNEFIFFSYNKQILLYCLQTTSNVKLSNISFRRIKGTSASPVAVQLFCSPNNPCAGVELADIDLGGGTSECANVNPTISGVYTPSKCAA